MGGLATVQKQHPVKVGKPVYRCVEKSEWNCHLAQLSENVGTTERSERYGRTIRPCTVRYYRTCTYSNGEFQLKASLENYEGIIRTQWDDGNPGRASIESSRPMQDVIFLNWIEECVAPFSFFPL